MELLRTGNAEIGDDFKAGTGDAMDSSGSRSSRRKRSSRLINGLIKHVSSTGHRSKRQATGEMPDMSGSANPNSDSAFDKIKAAFARIMDATKALLQKLKQSMGSGSGDQNTPLPNNVEPMK